jgi:hypothetical protein
MYSTISEFYLFNQPTFCNDNIFWNIANRDQVGAAPSRVQMMAVGCQRAFAARTAVTWFEGHLVADIFFEPHETKNPHWSPTLLYRHLAFNQNTLFTNSKQDYFCPRTEGCQGEIGFPKIQLFFLIRVHLLSKPTKINDFWIFGHIWLKTISILWR